MLHAFGIVRPMRHETPSWCSALCAPGHDCETRKTKIRSRNQYRFKGIVQMTTSQVICQCGALYERTEFNAEPRQSDEFVCPACGHTLEIYTSAKAPHYRLISVPPQKPEVPSN